MARYSGGFDVTTQRTLTPMELEIIPVTTSRQRRQFLQLPWRLYAHDEMWVPPLRQMQKELVGYARHPFQDNAQIQTFLALRNGEPVGRIAAILNRFANQHFGEERGYWGFFESVDDVNVAHRLFDAVRDWFGERSIRAIRGPANPSMNYECGLLIDGFHLPPTFLMPYNPPYYQHLVESYGYVKAQDLFTFVGTDDQLGTLDPKLQKIMEGAKERFNVVLRPLSKRRFKDEITMFLDVYNRSMAGMWGFVPLTGGEIKRMSKELKMLILPELAIVAEIDKQPIGVVFGMPDYNPRIKKIDGRLFPFGFLTLLSRKPFTRFRAISTTVVPEYQMWGLGLVLLAGLIPAFKAAGLQEAEFSWVAESNHLSRSSLERGGARLEKTHRMYDSPPEGALPAP
jgi:hypothetical protein